MTQYYFLGTLVPSLKMGELPEISFAELMELFRVHLSEEDWMKTVVIRRYFDLENLRAFWLEQPLDVHGNLDAMQLEEALLMGVGFPDYVYDFLDKYSTTEARLDHFGALQAAYFRIEGGLLKGEREIQLVLAALRAKQLGRDLLREMQFEEHDDPIVAQIVAQKDAASYEPPAEFKPLKELFNSWHNQPLALHKALLEYRFAQIEEAAGLQRFTIERLLAYMYQLILCERWIGLKGNERLLQGAA